MAKNKQDGVTTPKAKAYAEAVVASDRVKSFSVDGDAGSAIVRVNDSAFVFDAEQFGALRQLLAEASINIVR